MSARAIIAPVSFGDNSLPRIDLTYTRPIPGASYDWAINRMPNGPLSQWPSLIDGTILQADGTSPNVIFEGKSKNVRFDGLTSRMRARFTLDGPQTIVAVYQLINPAALDTVHYGYANTDAGSLGVSGDGVAVRAISGSSALLPSPTVAPDSGWHISILTVNGASSVLRIDNSESLGTLTAGTRDGLTLGFSGAATNRTTISYKRVAILPGATTTSQRDSIMAHMRSEYVG